MARYLTPSQIESALNRGKSVEQFLGGTARGHISWVELRPQAGKTQIWHFETEDNGSLEYVDIYSFCPIGEDWPEEPVDQKDTYADAMTAAEQLFGAAPDRWVNQFVAQEEYKDFKKSTQPL